MDTDESAVSGAVEAAVAARDATAVEAFPVLALQLDTTAPSAADAASNNGQDGHGDDNAATRPPPAAAAAAAAAAAVGVAASPGTGGSKSDSKKSPRRSSWNGGLQRRNKDVIVGTPGRVLIRLAARARARANAALKSPRLATPMATRARAALGSHHNNDNDSDASAATTPTAMGVGGAVDTTAVGFTQDAIFNSPTIRSRHNSVALYEQSPPNGSGAVSYTHLTLPTIYSV